jgi:hypothetical protein
MSFVDVEAAEAQHQEYLKSLGGGPLADAIRAATEEGHRALLARHGVGVPSEVYARARADVDKQIASLSVDDPSSPVYKRVDLRDAAVARLEDGLRQTMIRFGVTPPPPKTAEEIAHEEFEANWSSEPISPYQTQLVSEQILADNKLSPEQRASRVAALVREFGQAEYDQLVKEAKAGWNPKEPFPPGVLSNKFALQNVAALGRRELAYARARKAAGYAP